MLPGQSGDHLLKLAPDIQIVAWLAGFKYEAGRWSERLAHKTLEDIIASGHKLTGKKQKRRFSAELPSSRPNPARPEAAAGHGPGPAPPPVTPQPGRPSKPRPEAARPRKRPTGQSDVRPEESDGFTIGTTREVQIANLSRFNRTYTSFENRGGGDCLFCSFQQRLDLRDDPPQLRARMVAHIEACQDPDTRVTHLNEYIAREADAGARKYQNCALLGTDPAGAVDASAVFRSPRFAELWSEYRSEMTHGRAYAGNSEALALATMYDVNLTVWRFNPRNSQATHIFSHPSASAGRPAVHILSKGNRHFESTNIPSIFPELVLDRSTTRPSRHPGFTAAPRSFSHGPPATPAAIAGSASAAGLCLHGPE